MMENIREQITPGDKGHSVAATWQEYAHLDKYAHLSTAFLPKQMGFLYPFSFFSNISIKT